MTGHGFRGLAATVLRELGYSRDVVDRQLAHAERNQVTAAYVQAEYLPERRKMMRSGRIICGRQANRISNPIGRQPPGASKNLR